MTDADDDEEAKPEEDVSAIAARKHRLMSDMHAIASGAKRRIDPNTPPVANRGRHREMTPAQRALGLLVRREHSRKELARKLVARGIDADEVRITVDRMTSEGWQDDARFAELLIRSRAGGGYGPIRIGAELGTHGLDRDAITAAMAAFDGDWNANARALARRRFGARISGDRGLQRRAADFLIRRGFTAEQARTAIRFDPEDPGASD